MQRQFTNIALYKQVLSKQDVDNEADYQCFAVDLFHAVVCLQMYQI